ncbi:uncharacterized protein KQ657_005159 [Scheffersomyces spartinae]|uniref:Uncharacterized protein n=1 Tax=Scheffersomyces spartinae TaxID=45513 RepID=A0A9P7VA19_9ASCO|nr:uncharacterized protein KQ657_005159 [Scheffersomyces spartinae]KAG7193960.1 hypothetical protein KQ657_005159 [Scheffersomyces spartinae]
MISKGVAESRYQLALKLFVSRNFDKSFQHIRQLYNDIITTQPLHLPVALVGNIVKLYLTEIGTIFSRDDAGMDYGAKKAALASLKNDTLHYQLQDLYEHQFEQDIPCDIWYTLLSAEFVLRNQIYSENQDTELVKKFQSALDTVHSSGQDPTLKKLVDLFVFQVLPAYNMFDRAELIITQHPVYVNKMSESQTKLDRIRQNQRAKAEEERKMEVERKKLEQEIKAKEILRKKELEKERLQKNRAIKEINDSYMKDSSLNNRQQRISSNSSSISLVSKLTSRITYLASVSQEFMKENAIIILATILIAFLASKFINLKKINIREKISETIKMAFKVTYL